MYAVTPFVEGAIIKVHGIEQGYQGLPVAHKIEDDIYTITTAWVPTPDELERLFNGGNVEIKMLSHLPPPMLVTVGAIGENSETLLAPFAEIAKLILAEAPADATEINIFTDCEGCKHVVSLDYLRRIVASSAI